MRLLDKKSNDREQECFVCSTINGFLNNSAIFGICYLSIFLLKGFLLPYPTFFHPHKK